MFLVAQIGARRHYDVPRGLAKAGLLESFFTDILATSIARALLGRCPERALPACIRRWGARVASDLPEDRIRTFPLFGLEYVARQRLAASRGALTAAHLWAGREFCRRVLRGGLGAAKGVYTFNSAGLEILQAARERGLLSIMEQTSAPTEVEDELLAAEEADFPDWEVPYGTNPYRREVQERERAEWTSADIIVCGSEFVREGIRRCGGPVERCRVVPYTITPNRPPVRQHSADRPLRVLTVGAVNLQKGAPYVLDAAKMLGGAAQFRMVGRVALMPRARARLAEHVELTGAVPRPEVTQHYHWADVFLLPSISEGSAGVVYEALAAGLPVITTPNAGSIVRDGVDGFVVPIRDPEAVAERLMRLARDRELLVAMAGSAVARSAEFTVNEYGRRLHEALGARSENEEMLNASRGHHS